MKTNLPQHPCAGKCQRFTNEPCHTCLVQQIEKREFDLGVAPDDAYVKDHKFKINDSVVYMNHIEINNLHTVESYQPYKHYWLENGQLVYEDWIRLATLAEQQSNRRLSPAEQALAEVP